jgi:hypothetical protein
MKASDWKRRALAAEAVLADALKALDGDGPLLVDGRPRGGATVAYGATLSRNAACARVIRGWATKSVPDRDAICAACGEWRVFCDCG